MSWIIPENKLDEQQKDFVENVDINQRNVWIKGFQVRESLFFLPTQLRKSDARPHLPVSL